MRSPLTAPTAMMSGSSALAAAGTSACSAKPISPRSTQPPRFSAEPINVAGEERVVSTAAIVRMRRDYYRARGWDEKGRPSPELLESLGINRLKTP